MGNNVQRVLFVNSEMTPYLEGSRIADIGRNLPQGIQERKKDIRSFMPRFGCINERKNQLHEVIRLSGMNIIINDVDRPLIIKVASISSARIKVYFIDNEDYFRRKSVYGDEKTPSFADNDERAIFYARGVLETVKKLRWAPEIIHCQGWFSQLVPLYLKRAYKDDPIFSESKIVLSLYDDTPTEKFSPDFASKALYGAVSAEDVALLADEATGINLAKMAIKYSDGVIMGSSKVDSEIVSAVEESSLPVLKYSAKAIENGSYVEEYNNFYDKV